MGEAALAMMALTILVAVLVIAFLVFLAAIRDRR
jgi:hypothetical protein